MKLALKLSSLLVIGMVAVLTVEAYQSVRRERNFFQADMRRDAELLGHSLMTLVADVWRTSGQQRALELIHDANRRESLVEIRWVWLDARSDNSHRPRVEVSALGAVADGKEASFITSTGGPDGSLVTYVPVVVPGGRPGALELAESFSEMEAYSRTTMLRAWQVVGTLVVLGAVGVMLLGTGLVGRPLQRLVLAVRRIGQGDVGVRVRPVRHDELGELAEALNLMCQQLADTRAAVELETELRITALEQLRHADRLSTVGRIAAGIAHEVGTPLNVISARAKQLAGEDLPATEAREYALTIGRQSDRIAKIIRQLLDYSRSGQASRTPQDLVQIVDRSVGLLQSLAHKRSVALEIAAPAEQVLVSAVPQQLEQVVTNLVMNALQATGSGGRVDVRVSRAPVEESSGRAGPATEFACFSISDNGVGIRRENLERIFEPFFTTKGAGEGTGLGLSLAREIVREHGGQIEVTSQAGAGTCFVVQLPLLPQSPVVECCAAS